MTLIVSPDMIGPLQRGLFPDIEKQLVQLAREGNLKGVNQKAPRYSASTIQNHADCVRKFYWPTLAGLEEPPSPAQEFGTALHAIQEKWLKTGEPPQRTSPEGVLASIGLHLLPKPGTPGLAVEEPFEVQLDDLPVVITGTKDFVVRPTERDASGFVLGDHKTAGSMNPRYKKTKIWLVGNIQANTYAYVEWAHLASLGFNDLKVVDKRWIYYFKQEREAECLRVVDSLDNVSEQYETVIKPNILDMARMVREAPRVTDLPLPKDPATCDAYGGCKHRARCFGGLKESQMGVLSGNFSKQAIAQRLGAGSEINPPKPPPLETKAAEPVEVQAPAAAEVVVEEPKAKKATKPKAEAAPAEAVRTEAPQTYGKSLRAPGANADHQYWLFVGCGPTKGLDGSCVYVEDIIGSAQAEAAQRTGAGHYREGQSYGVLETAFASWMEQNAIVGAVRVDPNTIVARDVIGLLRAHAQIVIERTM